MIKQSYWIIITMVWMGFGKLEAQTHTKADRLFDNGAYYKAYEEYSKELIQGIKRDVSGYAEYHIGECFLRMNRYQGAIEWFKKAEELGYGEKELDWGLGEAYLISGNYTKSKAYFLKYKMVAPNDKRTEARITSCEWGMIAPRENSCVTITRLPYINSRGSEYGVTFFAEGLIYSSTGDLSLTRRNDLSERTGLGCSKPYLSYRLDGDYQPGVLIKGLAKTNANEGTFSFDKATNLLYYTRCEAGEKNCHIISARFKNGRFREIGRLKLDNNNYNILHPFVTDNGKRLYFSSDMEGGVGGTDIWYVDLTEKGKWGKPVNAGIWVNTAGNEGFPCVWNNTLFFASDGHVGYGGLDLYRIEIGTETVENMGAGLNTSYDDFNLIMNENGKGGMFISNRYPENGDDIFRFDINPVEKEPEEIALEEYVQDVEESEPENEDVEMNAELPLQDSVAHIEGYEYEIPEHWWVQVAMLRKSMIVERSLALDVSRLTGKNIKVFESQDGGRYFYIGDFKEEEEARRMVAILKEAKIDCFIKNAMR